MPVPSLLVQRPGPSVRRAVDLLVAVAAGLLCLYAAADTPASAAPRPAWVAVIAGVGLGGPLLVRRRWPVATAVTVAAVSAVLLATRIIPDYAFPAPMTVTGVTLYTIGLLVPGRRGVTGAVASTGVLLVGTGFGEGSADSPGATGLAFAALICAASWAIGWTLRERRRHARLTATQSTAQAVAEERLRIAREMHDAVGHSLSLIAVKAAVANHVARQRPEEVGDALQVIEAESRSALAELRRVVGALRTEPEYGTPPTLGDLELLATRAESAGIPVRLDIAGCEHLPESMAAAAYRIVQESLTNVVRHAAPASCRVHVEAAGGELRISVTDDGARRAASSPGGGTGLAGMRERVAAFGGTFSAGPRPGGGFAVVATLPYDAAAAQVAASRAAVTPAAVSPTAAPPTATPATAVRSPVASQAGTSQTGATPEAAPPLAAPPLTAPPLTAPPLTAPPLTAPPLIAPPLAAAPSTAAPLTAAPLTAAPLTAAPLTASQPGATPEAIAEFERDQATFASQAGATPEAATRAGATPAGASPEASTPAGASRSSADTGGIGR